jgi:hypothetical protein
VFTSSSDPAIAQQVHVDTTFTFAASRNYTFALRGFARAGQTPRVVAAIQPDAPPAGAAGQIGLRVWQLAPGLDPSATTPLDVWVVARGSAALSGSPTIAGLSYADTSGYVNLATGTYRVAFTAAGTAQPILFQANMPTGGSGIGGTTAGGSAMTVVVVPRSMPGSRAPFPFTAIQAIATLTSNPDSTVTALTAAPHGLTTGNSVVINGADTAVYNGTFSVTVVDATTFRYRASRTTAGSPATGYPFLLPASSAASFNGLPTSRLTATGTTATLITLASPNVSKNDIITVSGANEPGYNGTFGVDSVSGTTIRYTANGTPATPATGAPVWRKGADDFTGPSVMFLIDRRP